MSRQIASYRSLVYYKLQVHDFDTNRVWINLAHEHP